MLEYKTVERRRKLIIKSLINISLSMNLPSKPLAQMIEDDTEIPEVTIRRYLNDKRLAGKTEEIGHLIVQRMQGLLVDISMGKIETKPDQLKAIELLAKRYDPLFSEKIRAAIIQGQSGLGRETIRANALASAIDPATDTTIGVTPLLTIDRDDKE